MASFFKVLTLLSLLVGASACLIQSDGTAPVASTGGTTTVPEDTTNIYGRFALGDGFTCFLNVSGQVKCWGANNVGQLGYGNTNNIGDDELPDTVSYVSVGGTVTQIDAGASHVCALKSDGQVVCWGEGGSGQLGRNSTNDIGDGELPSAGGGVVSLGNTATQIAVSGDHSCALLVDGTVRCWGLNDHGQLGLSSMANLGDNEHPTSVAVINLGTTATAIAAGYGHVCAILASGNVKCWGQNTSGQLGYGNFTDIGDNEHPNAVGSFNFQGASASSIYANGSHNCILTTGGETYCWGGNSAGQLGYGNIVNIGGGTAADAGGPLSTGGTVTQLSLGSSYTCALLSTGTLRCFGSNTFGQLGLGSTDNIGNDEAIAGYSASVGGRVGYIGAGSSHVCAWLRTGAARCWGTNGAGQLGLGNGGTTIGDDELPDSFSTVVGVP